MVADHGYIHDYETGEPLYPASAKARAESMLAAAIDGGAGVIECRGRSVYVPELPDDDAFRASALFRRLAGASA